MHLHLIRHAQSMNNATAHDPYAEHVLDAPLTPLGHQQAQHLASRIRRDAEDDEAQAALQSMPHIPVYKIDLLYASPMHRALQTAKPIADALDLAVHVMKDLHESGGAYQRRGVPGEYTYHGHSGMTRAEILQVMPRSVFVDNDITETGWWNREMESFADFSARAVRLTELMRQHAAGEWQGKHVAFVMHADIIDMLLQTLLGRTPPTEEAQDAVRFGIYNTSVTRLDFFEEGLLRLRYVNRVDHLPAHMVTH